MSMFHNKLMKTFRKYLIFSLYLSFVLLLTNCKKVPWYGISDDMKQSFSFKQGSYWIYKNDSTGLSDSTFVSSYTHVDNDNTYAGLTREGINMQFNSKFLNYVFISYVICAGPDYLGVSSIAYPVPGQTQPGPLLAYDPNLPQNTNLITDCFQDGKFFYHSISFDTINNIPYQNVIYSELRSNDSSLYNQYLIIRKIYFAKNIGIIKYYELDRHYKINRSYSLLRYKVIQ